MHLRRVQTVAAAMCAIAIGAGLARAQTGAVAVGLSGRYYDLGHATYVTTYPFGTAGRAGSTVTLARHRTSIAVPSIGVVWRL